MSAVERYKNQSDAQPDACQGTVTYHDTNPFAAGFTNLNGRAAVLEYHICTTESNGAVKDRLVREMYGYSTAGSVLSKRLQVTRTDLNPQGQPVTGSANLDATYTWWFPGRLKSMRYPDLRQGHPQRHAGENGDFFEYQVDGGGRYTGMTVTPLSSGAAISQVSGIQYDASGAMKEMVYSLQGHSVKETRTFDPLGQMTRMTGVDLNAGNAQVFDLEYVFPAAGANNGRIGSMKDWVTGENVTYVYDQLNRLDAANGTGVPGVIGSWARDYQYDGFGNLKSDGAASWGVDASTNRLTSGTHVGYDANGNLTKMPDGTGNATNTYDLENRMVESTSQPGVKYGYGPDNRRMWIQRANGTEEWQFWGPNGKVLASYSLAWDWTYAQPYFDTKVSQKNWLGSKELGTVEDRLGSKLVSHGAMKFRNDHLPYGSSYTASAGYATYNVDSPGSTQYADQRYYQGATGRFMTADPYHASGGAGEPTSWNRYAYSSGDPVSFNDPNGLATCWVGTRYTDPFGNWLGKLECDSKGGLLYDSWILPVSGPLSEPHNDPMLANAATVYGGILDRNEFALLTLRIGDAVKRASDRIANPTCSSLFLGSGENNTPEARRALSAKLSSLGDNNGIRLIYRENMPEGTNTTYAFTTGTFGLIYVVAPGAFFDGMLSTGGQISNSAGFSRMSLAQVQEAVIIHEFLHYMGVVGPDAGQAIPSYTLPNGRVVRGSEQVSEAVRDACFR